MRRLLLLLLLAACCGHLHASITISLSGGQLLTSAGAPVPDGGLIQLLAAPAGTAFTAPSADSFTGGASDEIVLASFSLESSSTGIAGDFDQVIQLTLSGGLQAGDPLLLRWYPTLTTAAAAPGGGTSYGQFRTDAVVDGSDIAWVMPGDGATDALSFATSSQGGSQPDSAGEASETTPGGSPVENPPQITSATTAEAVVGQAFTYQITASNTPTLYKATGLPAGLSVDGGSGLISGTPTQAGDFSIALEASNAAGAGSATLTLSVQAPAIQLPQITSATTAEAMVGQAFSYQITASNTPTLYRATGLPAGLSVDGASGLISGTPTQAGDFSIALKASNAAGAGAATLMLSVQAPPAIPFPKITSANAADAVSGQSFAYQIAATESPATFGATGLPPALAIDATTGLISGVVSQAGVFHISLSATNAGGTGTAALTLTVEGAPAPPPPVVSAPVITSVLSVNAETGLPFSYQITASNQPMSFGASPLPEGLEVISATGFVSGTPTAAGEYAILVSAANTAGNVTATLLLNVSAPPLPVVTVTAAIPEVTIGSGVAGRFTIRISKTLTQPLTVFYALKGSAVDGTDYQLLARTKVIPAGKRQAFIKVIPRGDLDGMARKIVSLVLKPRQDYKIGTKAPVKIEILPRK